MQQLELKDIQGIIIRGYGSLDDTYFVLLKIEDVPAAKGWLAGLAEEVRNGETRPHEPVVNLAFTFQGLQRLGLGEDIMSQFAREFQEGMTTEHRRRALGDHAENAPDHWAWGGPGNEEIHLLLMLYAQDRRILDEYYESHAERFRNQGLAEVHRLHGLTLEGRKEHFGFRDGIAQPLIEGLNKPGADTNRVKAGEFLLGYVNEYEQYPESPLLEPGQDQSFILNNAANVPELRDFGRNGSYLVFRQMAQGVKEFWQSLDNFTKHSDGTGGPEGMVALASKMVGRWPSGAPLDNSSDRDNPELKNDNDFLYHQSDPHGFSCPIGSHIRRTNPRDMLDPDPGSQESIDIGNRHRIIRRGRAYGPPIAESMDPAEILNGEDDGQERGLHFLCFNTSLGRQFEFIQQTWANGRKFAGLYDDADPLIGDHDPRDEGRTGTFSVQASPVRRRVRGIPKFVQIRGGAYFFMPGVRALRYIADL
jgi:Dyp-type peroxidase family